MTYGFPLMVLRDHLSVIRQIRRDTMFDADISPADKDATLKQLSREIAETESAMLILGEQQIDDLMILLPTDDEIRLGGAYL